MYAIVSYLLIIFNIPGHLFRGPPLIFLLRESFRKRSPKYASLLVDAEAKVWLFINKERCCFTTYTHIAKIHFKQSKQKNTPPKTKITKMYLPKSKKTIAMESNFDPPSGLSLPNPTPFFRRPILHFCFLCSFLFVLFPKIIIIGALQKLLARTREKTISLRVFIHFIIWTIIFHGLLCSKDPF